MTELKEMTFGDTLERSIRCSTTVAPATSPLRAAASMALVNAVASGVPVANILSSSAAASSCRPDFEHASITRV